jgi:hypothetical protein
MAQGSVLTGSSATLFPPHEVAAFPALPLPRTPVRPLARGDDLQGLRGLLLSIEAFQSRVQDVGCRIWGVGCKV